MDAFILSTARSPDVVGASVALVVSSESLISLM